MASNSMDLLLPTPDVTVAWATQLNDQLETVVAEHTHLPGSGVPVPAAALDINADLPMGGNNLTNTRSVRLAQEVAVADLADLGCIYRIGDDLYYRDGLGVEIQITAAGALAASSLGGINGLPSGTASAGFSTDTFTWKKTSTKLANMASGPVQIYSGNDTSPTKSVTLQSIDSLPADVAITLPSALPAATSFQTISSTGVMQSNIPIALGIDSSMLAANSVIESKIATGAVSVNKLATDSVSTIKVIDGAITRAKQGSAGPQISSSCGAYSYFGSTAFQNITNLAVSLTVTTLRPIMISFQGDATLNTPYFGGNVSEFKVVVSGADTATPMQMASTTTQSPSTMNFLYTPSNTGTLTFTTQGRTTLGDIANPVLANYMKILATQL